ncbi:hypothetical protein ATE80_02925 [Streptomyces kanasensis]|uniref:Uncharacterized protein n=1 Tax=Streptomyces kanasensis TaxID=936756 RepID=A0A117IXA9_9ACTN|nr:hypothetical protein ATE80_02925 [Streptomyces kanasensis]
MVPMGRMRRRDARGGVGGGEAQLDDGAEVGLACACAAGRGRAGGAGPAGRPGRTGWTRGRSGQGTVGAGDGRGRAVGAGRSGSGRQAGRR